MLSSLDTRAILVILERVRVCFNIKDITYLCKVAASDHIVGVVLERVLEGLGNGLEGSKMNHAVNFVLKKRQQQFNQCNTCIWRL